ncbi:MAG: hypothetical protein ACLFU8_07735 [Anaerolineales bacterium]
MSDQYGFIRLLFAVVALFATAPLLLVASTFLKEAPQELGDL